MQMWEIVELEKRESREEGLLEGEAKGKAVSILELLEEVGVVSEDLRETILSQRDMDILKKWIKLSARAATIDEFMEKMN